MDSPHIPVLLKEMIQMICDTSTNKEFIYIDATFGAGGYSKALLETTKCTVYAFDRDHTVEQHALKLHNTFTDRFKLFIDKFSNIDIILKGKKIDAVIFDLGMSSMQIAESDRGFSFMKEGHLDMRMSQQGDTLTAATVINSFAETEIADIIYQYGNERHSRKIASAIIRSRNIKCIETTTQLAEIIRSTLPQRKKSKIDAATKTFQAIRIFINDELTELRNGINAAKNLLTIGGKLAIVAFHSLEDQIVKNQFNILCGTQQKTSRHFPIQEEEKNNSFTHIAKKAIKPQIEEITANPRSRSARLRVIKKIS